MAYLERRPSHTMENELYSIFPIKSISHFSFMAAKRNYFHQEFCIIFHFIQLYKSDSEGLANIFHFNLQSNKCWLRTYWASVPLGMQGQSEPAPGPGRRWQFSSSSLAGESLLLKCRNKVRTSHTSKHSNQMT